MACSNLLKLCIVSAFGIAGPQMAPVSAYAAPTVEFEDWSTPLSPNPLSCSGLAPGGGCSPGSPSATTGPQGNITPLPAGQVTRTATLNETVAGGDAVGFSGQVNAATMSGGCATDPTEGCLVFATGKGSVGSLTLNYKFAAAKNLQNVGLKINNAISPTTFDVAAFYLDSASVWHFSDLYTILGHSPTKTYAFDFGAMTDQVEFIYNPLSGTDLTYVPAGIPGADFHIAVDDIDVELCCVMTNVPEPDSLSLLGFILLSIAAVRRHKSR